jgi:hypothetical protein
MSTPKITPRTLKAGWGASKGESSDLCTTWGKGCQSSDSRFLNHGLFPIIKELERRGYDLNTLRFSIKLKDPTP